MTIKEARQKLKAVIPEYEKMAQGESFQNRLHAEGVLDWIDSSIKTLDDDLLPRVRWFFLFRKEPHFHLMHQDWQHQLKLKSYDHCCLDLNNPLPKEPN